MEGYKKEKALFSAASNGWMVLIRFVSCGLVGFIYFSWVSSFFVDTK
jgi:hypothetical protein